MPAIRNPFADGDLHPGDADPDYLYFLRKIRLDGDSYILELPAEGSSPRSLKAPLASSDGECVSDPSTGLLSTNRGAQEKESSASVEAEPAWYDSPGDVDEDYRVFLQHTRLVDGQLVLEIGDLVVNYDQPDAPPSGGNGEAEVEESKTQSEGVATPGEVFDVGGERKGVALASPATPVPNLYACDWQADPVPGQEDEGLSDKAAACAAKGVDWEASSSNGRDSGLRSAVAGKAEKELGIVWPAHITQRPDSDFKRRLIQALTKPASRKEYYKLFEMATLRTPLMKLRQVRTETKFYPTEEMGSSYLDHYPDLADQIMNTGSRHGLALMRGFFFWLQNNAYDDQFKPWVDDSKDPEVIPLPD